MFKLFRARSLGSWINKLCPRFPGATNLQASTTHPPTLVNVLMESYHASLLKGDLSSDPDQEKIITELQFVFNTITASQTSITKNYLNKLFSWLTRAQHTPYKPIKGLYIWGGVGRGKTYLVNDFYKHIPGIKKLRLHFYRFMQLVHEDLNKLEGVADPLKTVATNLSEKTRLLCLDEIHITDITDAMLLGKLFEYLFDEGITLVATSNYPPEELYKNGLQRDRFLPAIHLLNQHTKVVRLGGNIDYRLKTLQEEGVFIINDPLSEQQLETCFNKLSGVTLHRERTDIIINKRRIPVKKWADGIVWFSFDELCNTPRSAVDYHQIGRFFNTVMISDIPVMDSSMNDIARRFVIMIDEFYDLHVNLVISATTEPELLYTSHKLAFDFQRTASRLREMQSKQYIATRHLNNDSMDSLSFTSDTPENTEVNHVLEG